MDIIKIIAKENSVSEKEVYNEMLEAINSAKKNPDPKVQMMWSSLFPDSKEPTPEEFIRVIAQEVKTKICF